MPCNRRRSVYGRVLRAQPRRKWCSLTGTPIASDDVPRGLKIRKRHRRARHDLRDRDGSRAHARLRARPSARRRAEFAPGRWQGRLTPTRTWSGPSPVPLGCDFIVNEGPQTTSWLKPRWSHSTGGSPTAYPLLRRHGLELSTTRRRPSSARDQLGNALGGVRLPPSTFRSRPSAGRHRSARAGSARCSVRRCASTSRPSSPCTGTGREFWPAYRRSLDVTILGWVPARVRPRRAAGPC